MRVAQWRAWPANVVQDFAMSHRALAAVITAVIVTVFAVAPAHAQSDLTGRWDSDSLRDNDIGYFMVLDPVPNTSATYVGFMRFAHRDGRRNARMPIKAVVSGDTVAFTTRRGSFDKSAGVLRGELDSKGGTLTLTNCMSRLRLVMANALDSDCVLRLENRR